MVILDVFGLECLLFDFIGAEEVRLWIESHILGHWGNGVVKEILERKPVSLDYPEIEVIDRDLALVVLRCLHCYPSLELHVVLIGLRCEQLDLTLEDV